MRQYAASKDIYVDRLNGHVDHVHILFYMNNQLSIAQHLQFFKGESAFWANKCNLFDNKLHWAEEYYAASVSESIVPKVQHYIDYQREHHRTRSFDEELNLLMRNSEHDRRT